MPGHIYLKNLRFLASVLFKYVMASSGLQALKSQNFSYEVRRDFFDVLLQHNNFANDGKDFLDNGYLKVD